MDDLKQQLYEAETHIKSHHFDTQAFQNAARFKAHKKSYAARGV